MADDSELEVVDIYLAAYLKHSGCLIKGKRSQGRRVFITFTNPAGSINQLRDAYYSGAGGYAAYAREIMNMKQLVNGPG